MTAPQRLLLVEDDEVLRRAVARRLRRGGFEVVVAETGAAASAAAGPFDVAVFDIDLPDASGIDIAESLLTEGRVGRAVFFSGTVLPAIIARAKLLGTFVEKAAGVDELLNALRQNDREASVRARAVGSPEDGRSRFPTEPPSAVRRRT